MFVPIQRLYAINYYRDQAFEAAEAGLEYGKAYLKDNYQTIIADTAENSGTGNGFIDTYLSSLINTVDNGHNTLYNVTYTNTTINNFNTIEVISKGSSDAGLVALNVSEKIARITFSSVTPKASLISMGNVSLSGNALIENTATDHTIWTGGDILLSGSASTEASNGVISDRSIANTDLSRNDTQLSNLTKDEFFTHMFGADRSTVESHADIVLTYNSNQNLSTILENTDNNGKSIWINQTAGTASLSGNATIGSADKPVFLVINGDFKANGKTEIYGIIYITQDWNNSGGGNLTIHGAVIVEGNMSGTGTPNINYDYSVITKTLNKASFSKIPGSWRDFQTMKNINLNFGASLVEALITVSIISIGTLSLTNLQTKLIRSNAISYQNTDAMTLADEKLEQLRSFTSLSAYEAIISGKDKSLSGNTTYQRSWTVTSHTSPNFKKILLNVTWTKRDSTKGEVMLDSQIAYYQPLTTGNIMAMQSTSSINLMPITPSVATSMTSSSEEVKGKSESKGNSNK